MTMFQMLLRLSVLTLLLLGLATIHATEPLSVAPQANNRKITVDVVNTSSEGLMFRVRGSGFTPNAKEATVSVWDTRGRIKTVSLGPVDSKGTIFGYVAPFDHNAIFPYYEFTASDSGAPGTNSGTFVYPPS